MTSETLFCQALLIGLCYKIIVSSKKNYLSKDLRLMRNFHVLFILLFVLSQLPLAHASGNELLQQCNEALKVEDNDSGDMNDLVSAGLCLAYISGIKDTLMLATAASPDSAIRTCIPEEVTTFQAARVVTKYLENHPEKLHEEEFFLTVTALRNSFPCD